MTAYPRTLLYSCWRLPRLAAWALPEAAWPTGRSPVEVAPIEPERGTVDVSGFS